MFGCLLVVTLLFFTGCDSSQSASGRTDPTPHRQPARQVRVARAVTRPVERTVTAVGSLAAQDQATLSTKVEGRLQTLSVDLGTQVRKTELIAQIESRDYQLRVNQAEAALAQARARLGLPLEDSSDRIEPEKTSTVRQAQALLDEARRNHERVTKLWEQKVLSQSEVDTTAAAYSVALNRYQDALEEIRNREAMVAQRRAELEIARQQFADTTIAAPFDGTIQERRANIGEYLAAGSPIVTLVRMDPLRLRLEISEKEAFKIRESQKVRVTLEGTTNIYSGEIKRLSPALNERSRILLIEADVRNDGSLHPGSFARAAIVIDENAPALTVPPNAIVTFAGIEKVLSIHEGKAVEKRIATGDRATDWIEIVSGLKTGDVVILNPGNLQTGYPVVGAD